MSTWIYCSWGPFMEQNMYFSRTPKSPSSCKPRHPGLGTGIKICAMRTAANSPAAMRTAANLEALKFSSTLKTRSKSNPGLGTGMLQISQRHQKEMMTNEDDTRISVMGIMLGHCTLQYECPLLIPKVSHVFYERNHHKRNLHKGQKYNQPL